MLDPSTHKNRAHYQYVAYKKVKNKEAAKLAEQRHTHVRLCFSALQEVINKNLEIIANPHTMEESDLVDEIERC